mmetsp:Transcript_13178/g.41187  ORF Transcript_13178/g.41187 Transcript_13178/m.41187 type:complete len:203 (+) Transcript_13178:49-657(+)
MVTSSLLRRAILTYGLDAENQKSPPGPAPSRLSKRPPRWCRGEPSAGAFSPPPPLVPLAKPNASPQPSCAALGGSANAPPPQVAPPPPPAAPPFPESPQMSYRRPPSSPCSPRRPRPIEESASRPPSDVGGSATSVATGGEKVSSGSVLLNADPTPTGALSSKPRSIRRRKSISKLGVRSCCAESGGPPPVAIEGASGTCGA